MIDHHLTRQTGLSLIEVLIGVTVLTSGVASYVPGIVSHQALVEGETN